MTSLKVLFDEAMKKQWWQTPHSGHRSRNKTGFKWLCKINNSHYQRGYGWRYYRRINKEPITFYDGDLFCLVDKVITSGYGWIVLDEESAQATVESEGLDWNEFLDYIENKREKLQKRG